jgi:hypothetical protein
VSVRNVEYWSTYSVRIFWYGGDGTFISLKCGGDGILSVKECSAVLLGARGWLRRWGSDVWEEGFLGG